MKITSANNFQANNKLPGVAQGDAPKPETPAPKERFEKADAYRLEGKILQAGIFGAIGAYGGLGHGWTSQAAAAGVMGVAGARHGYNYGYHTATYCETQGIRGIATGTVGLVAGIAAGLAAKHYMGEIPAAVVMGGVGAALSWFGDSKKD